MANIKFRVLDPVTGAVVVSDKEIDERELPAKQALADQRKLLLQVISAPVKKQKPSPTPLPIPTPTEPSAVGPTTGIPLPPQTSPTAAEQFAISKRMSEEYGAPRSFMGGLLDGMSLGSTLDDISLLEEEQHPIAYPAGKIIGEMVPNIAADVGLARMGVPAPVASMITGGLTGAVSSANEAALRNPAQEDYDTEALVGGLAGAGGGLVGSAVGAPIARKAGSRVAEGLGLLTGMGKPVTQREAKEAAARGLREEVGGLMARKETAKTEKGLSEKAVKTAQRELKGKPSPEKPAGFDEYMDALEAGHMPSPAELKPYNDFLRARLPQIANKIKAKEDVEALVKEIASLDLDISRKQKLYASQLRRLAVPDNLKQYAMEYWDRAMGGLGAGVATESPNLFNRAVEEGRKAVSPIPVNPTQREVQAKAAMERLIQQKWEEERKKKSPSKGAPLSSALAPGSIRKGSL